MYIPVVLYFDQCMAFDVILIWLSLIMGNEYFWIQFGYDKTTHILCFTFSLLQSGGSQSPVAVFAAEENGKPEKWKDGKKENIYPFVCERHKLTLTHWHATSSCWQNIRNRLHRKLLKFQLSMQQVSKILLINVICSCTASLAIRKCAIKQFCSEILPRQLP